MTPSKRACPASKLNRPDLRAYLKRLADFDDVKAERAALDHAERHDNPPAALAFLVFWPAPDQAARLVTQRAAEPNGNYYEVYSPAAEALADQHPLAVTLLLRSMIDFTLVKVRSSRDRYAARHLLECTRLAAAIPSDEGVEPHDAYVAGLKAKHGRKSGFWVLV